MKLNTLASLVFSSGFVFCFYLTIKCFNNMDIGYGNGAISNVFFNTTTRSIYAMEKVPVALACEREAAVVVFLSLNSFNNHQIWTTVKGGLLY